MSQQDVWLIGANLLFFSVLVLAWGFWVLLPVRKNLTTGVTLAFCPLASGAQARFSSPASTAIGQLWEGCNNDFKIGGARRLEFLLMVATRQNYSHLTQS